MAGAYEVPGEGLFDCPFKVQVMPAKLTVMGSRQLVPTPEQQAAWLAIAIPHCTACPAFGGIDSTPANKIKARVKCSDCQSCGSKTIGPMQDCPRGHFKRVPPTS
jgi:hypothetical protein